MNLGLLDPLRKSHSLGMGLMPLNVVLSDGGRPPRELVQGQRLRPRRGLCGDDALCLFELSSLLHLTRGDLLEPSGILLSLRVGSGRL